MRRIATAARDALGLRHSVFDTETHLKGAMEWLARAHDAAGGNGVARSYALRKLRRHKRRGWLAAYPETTGYIIPTFLAYARLTGESEYTERAIRMAQWECEVQMENGAVQGGVIGFPQTPAVFNTGQVLFGLVSAYEENRYKSFLNCAVRAADFLLTAQDQDGAWRRHGSRYARPGVNIYDARTAWGLVEVWRVCEDDRYKRAATRNLDYVLARQHPNGWFPECCLDDDFRPLLHTLAYTMEGLLEAGCKLGETRYVEATKRTAAALMKRQRKDGALAGRFDDQWGEQARWSCLTGNAQTAIVWFRLYEETGHQGFLAAALRINKFLMSTQDLKIRDAGIRGGIKGSHPIWSEYGRFEYLNWAAKFFADALMLELTIKTPAGTSG